MAQLIYFLPGLDKATAEAGDLKAFGLEYAISERGVDTNFQTGNGPGGVGGVCVVMNGPKGFDNKPAQYVPDKQTWRKGPDGKYWVGMWNDAKPGPGELARDVQYHGASLRMIDDSEWIVPRCFSSLGERPSTLPVKLDIADDGKTVLQRVHPRYEMLCAGAFRFWRDFCGRSSAEEKLSGPEVINLAVSALAVNYRVGLIEVVGLLGLWGSDEHGGVLRAMIDADELEAWAAAQVVGEEAKKNT